MQGPCLRNEIKLFQIVLKPFLKLFKLEDSQNPVYHLYVIRTKNRDLLQKYLKMNGIETGIHYPISLNKLEAFKYLEQDTSDFISNQIANEILSLPIGDQLQDIDVEFVCKMIRRFYER